MKYKSVEAAAEGDAVADGQLTDLDAGVGGEGLVELEHEVPVVTHVLPQRRVGRGHHGPVPQRVVVADDSADLHQFDQSLVVVEVVVLVSVHEHKVEGSVILLLMINYQSIN